MILPETAYLNLLYTYNTLMDGGSTNNLLTQIQQTWSTEATTLRDELLLLSICIARGFERDVGHRHTATSHAIGSMYGQS